MTDWMPFALVLSASVFTLLWLLIDALERQGADVGSARGAYWVSLVLTATVYVVYLVAGESWIWY